MVKKHAKIADNGDIMSVGELFELLKRILLSREVIIVTVVIALYVNLVLYIVRYRKKSFRGKKPWRRFKPPAVSPLADEPSETDDEDDVVLDEE